MSRYLLHNAGGESLYEQQRGLILPLLEKSVAGINRKTIVEIGTGNGDVLSFLSDKFPDNNYIGVDFSVKNII